MFAESAKNGANFKILKSFVNNCSRRSIAHSKAIDEYNKMH